MGGVENMEKEPTKQVAIDLEESLLSSNDSGIE